MGQGALLGLDFGGGGGRCLLVELEGGRRTGAVRAWRFPADPVHPAASRIDVASSWRLLGEACREVLSRSGVAPEKVLGVAASGMRHGSVVLDAEGRELLAAPNRDARGLGKMLELAAGAGEELHARTGHWPHPVQPAGRLCWMAEHAPADWERAATHLSISDWIGFRLCGERVAEPSQASETLLFELEAPRWAWDWIERLGLPRALFPEVRAAGTRLGTLRAEAAEALGLRSGTPVAVGGGDTQCGLIGAGVLAAGQLAAVTGTTAPVQRVFARPTRAADGRLWAAHHAVAGRWVLESNAGGMGQCLEWIAGLLYPEATAPVVALLAEAAEAPPGAAGVLSSFGAEVMDARSLAVPLGHVTLSPLSAADDPGRRRHLARAIVEGMAYALRANAEQIERAAGVAPAPLRLAGGLGRSRFFAALLADVLGKPVEVPATPLTSALGAALCAGVGAGLFADLPEAAARLAPVARRHEPDRERSARYADLFAGWEAARVARGALDAASGGLVVGALAASGTSSAAGGTASDFRPRILVAADLDEEGLAALGRIGDVEYQSFRRAMRLLTGRGLVEALQGVHVFVTEVDVVGADALVDCPDLRVLAACRGDAVNIDLAAATALGIPVLNTPGRNADAVADLTVAFALMLARKLPQATAFLREPGGEAGDMGRMGRAFGKLQGRELWRKTFGLVGLGAVGRKVVERLRPFGVHCLVCDPFLEPDAVRLAGAEPVELDELLRRSDFVSLHAAVTEASRGLIGARELALLRDGAFLINTARAALVDEEALRAALASGRLGGAALDVFSVEPPASDDPLLALPNVIATPHVGGNTADVAAHQGQILAADLERMRAGERPHHLLNPETWEAFSWSQPRPAPSAELVAELGRGPGPAVTDLQKGRREAPGAAPARKPRPDADATRPDTAPPSEREESMQEIQEKFERILRAFVDGIVADGQLAEFARSGQDVTLHFVLSDLGSQFHFGFGDGAVHGDLGAPGGEAGVQLKMKADLLDGMFTGRRNAMQAAMDGELSFSGDTAKAMTLTHIQSDLNRLYRAAREAVGDPGDLTAIPDPSGAAAPAPAATAPPGDVRHQIVEIVNELYTTQLITSTGGNVSARCSDAPDQAWITPSQLFKGDLSPEILVRIGMDGKAVDPGARSPSSEALMHTAVFKAKPEAQAVIHCHAPHATILANAGLPFLPISTEAAFFVDIGRIPFIMPGTQQLADAIVEAMGDGWAVLMQNHGLLVSGRTLRRAADMAEIVERTAQVIIGCYAVGKEPPTLPPETVETLSKYGDLMA